MSPEVLARKLDQLRRYLEDLDSHRGRDAADLREEPYEVERLLELVVQVSVDVLAHQLAERGETPGSYRETFLLAAEEDLLPDPLARRLADAAGLRNVLVHLYEDIDYEVVAVSIGPALEDFGELLRLLERRLEDDREHHS